MKRFGVIALVLSWPLVASAQGLNGWMLDETPCEDPSEISYRVFDVTWPGSICHNDLETTDYYSHSSGLPAFAEVGGDLRTLHCPLETRQVHATNSKICDGDTYRWIVRGTAPNNNFMVRIRNNTSSEEGVSCTVTRRIVDRATGATQAEDMETEVSTTTGYETLFFNDMTTLAMSDDYFPYFHIDCSFDEVEDSSGVVSIWSGY